MLQKSSSASFHVSKLVPTNLGTRTFLLFHFSCLSILLSIKFYQQSSFYKFYQQWQSKPRNPRHSLGKVSKVSTSETWFWRESSHSTAMKTSTASSIMVPQVMFSSSRHSSNPGGMLLRTSWELGRKKPIKLLLLRLPA